MPELLRPWVGRVATPEAFVALNLLGEISRRVSAAYGQFLRPHGIDFSEIIIPDLAHEPWRDYADLCDEFMERVTPCFTPAAPRS